MCCTHCESPTGCFPLEGAGGLPDLLFWSRKIPATGNGSGSGDNLGSDAGGTGSTDGNADSVVGGAGTDNGGSGSGSLYTPHVRAHTFAKLELTPEATGG